MYVKKEKSKDLTLFTAPRVILKKTHDVLVREQYTQ